MSICKGCGASIDWIRTKAGKSMPVDPEPQFIITGEGRQKFVTEDGEVLTGRPAAPGETTKDTEVAFIPHWNTCPAAGQFRRR